jgi:hypothetical protein
MDGLGFVDTSLVKGSEGKEEMAEITICPAVL